MEPESTESCNQGVQERHDWVAQLQPCLDVLAEFVSDDLLVEVGVGVCLGVVIFVVLEWLDVCWVLLKELGAVCVGDAGVGGVPVLAEFG